MLLLRAQGLCGIRSDSECVDIAIVQYLLLTIDVYTLCSVGFPHLSYLSDPCGANLSWSVFT